jgi:hypothetical protein
MSTSTTSHASDRDNDIDTQSFSPEAAEAAKDSGRVGTGEENESFQRQVKRTTVEAEPSQQRRHTVFSWIPEVVSLAISITALAAIVALVASQDGKPLRNVLGSLTLNAAVAILASIFRASLIMPTAEAISELKWLWFANKPRNLSDMERFDQASRGPRGSLQFLFWKLPHNKLACLGAAITVLSIGTDTLSQSVIQPYACLVNSSESAAIHRTNNYTRFDPSGSQVGTYRLDSTMYLAMFEGVFNPVANEALTVPYECQSGYCNFPKEKTYSTLAMCHSTENITHRIHVSTNDVFLNGSNVQLNYHQSVFTVAETNRTTMKYDPDTPLFKLEALGHVGHQYQIRKYAFSGSIFPCIKTYGDIRIQDSMISQTLISTTRLPRIGGNGTDKARVATNYSLAGNIPSESGIDCTPDVSPGDRKTVATNRLDDGRYYVTRREGPDAEGSYSGMSAPDDEIPGRTSGPQMPMYFDPACTWTFGMGPTNAIRQALASFFGPQSSPRMYNEYIVASGDLWIQLFHEATEDDRSSDYLHNIVNSMTLAIRANGDATISQPVSGTVQRSETCVSFQWVYLLWNGILLGATLFFFAEMLLRSEHVAKNGLSQRGPWKSSALALLWCEVRGATLPRADTVKHIKQQAKQINAQLATDDSVSASLSSDIPTSTSGTSNQPLTENIELQSLTDVTAISASNVSRWIMQPADNGTEIRRRRFRKVGFVGSKYLPI